MRRCKSLSSQAKRTHWMTTTSSSMPFAMAISCMRSLTGGVGDTKHSPPRWQRQLGLVSSLFLIRRTIGNPVSVSRLSSQAALSRLYPGALRCLFMVCNPTAQALHDRWSRRQADLDGVLRPPAVLPSVEFLVESAGGVKGHVLHRRRACGRPRPW